MAKQKIDVHQEVTNRIIEQLEAGTRPWTKSWAGGISQLPLRSTGEQYRGINTILLMMAGYGNPHWMTYKQAEALGGQVRTGEKGTKVVFFKMLPVTDKRTGEDRNVPLIRQYTVFNADQIDDLPAKFYPVVDAQHSEDRIQHAEDFVVNCRAQYTETGDRAFYSPGEDRIVVPKFEAFDGAVSYYGTLLHELVHWTGADHRLERDLKNGFGTKDYAREELVAELGAAFLCSSLGLEPEPREDHAAYLASWLKVLKEDKKAIFTAATAAQKAFDFLYALQDHDLSDGQHQKEAA